jgi:type III secretion system regulator LcrR
MPRLFRDPFTQWLEARNVPLAVHQPAGFLGYPPVGWKLTIGQSTLVYRVPEETPETLIIVLFEKQSERRGLRSPFADIVRFVSLVKKSGAPIHRIQGHVDALLDRPEDSLENAKLAAFYQRYLSAHQVFVENGIEWFAGDLRTFVPPLATDRRWLQATDSATP